MFVAAAFFLSISFFLSHRTLLVCLCVLILTSSTLCHPRHYVTISPLSRIEQSTLYNHSVLVVVALVAVVLAAVQVIVGPAATISQQGIPWACTPCNGWSCCRNVRGPCCVPSRQGWTSPSLSPVVPVPGTVNLLRFGWD